MAGGRSGSGTGRIVLRIAKTANIAAVLAVIFISPFFRGLYFQQELLPFLAVIFLLFAFYWMIFRTDKNRVLTITLFDTAAFAFVIAYGLSLITAVGIHDAVIEWVKYCAYFSVFFMISKMADTVNRRLQVSWTIAGSGMLMCLMGMDAAFSGPMSNAFVRIYHLIGIPIGSAGLFEDGRINSTLQYPNALAAYLMAVFFITVCLAVVENKLITRIAAVICSYFALVVFLLTMSRGAFLIMPFAAALFIAALPKGARIKAVAFIIPAVVPAGVLSPLLTGYAGNPSGNAFKFILIVLGGAALSIFLHMFAGLLMAHANKLFITNWKTYCIIGAVCLTIVVSGVITALNATAPLVLSHSAVQDDSLKKTRKSIVLRPGASYKLVYDVDARANGQGNTSNNAYSIVISYRSLKGILFETDTGLAGSSGKSTKGVEKREIKFHVPSDSRMVNIDFINIHRNTYAAFHSALITDASDGKVVKKLKLKYRFIPDAIASRFEDIAATKSVVQRGIFYKDGLNIFKDNWLLGAGGGAWAVLYNAYQSYYYTTKQTHSYLLQVAIETGIPGVLAFILLIIAIVSTFVSTAVKMRRIMAGNASNKNANKTDEGYTISEILNAGFFTSIIAILAHSFIDFDLSIPAVSLLLWTLAGLLRSNSAYDMKSVRVVYKKNIAVPLLCLAFLAVAIIPVSFAFGAYYESKARSALASGDTKTSGAYIRKAIKADPVSPLYSLEYAGLLAGDNKVPASDEKIIRNIILRNDESAKYDADLCRKIALLYGRLGDIETALSYYDRMSLIKPLVPVQWEARVEGYRQAALYYFGRMDEKQGIKVIDKALSFISEAADANTESIAPFTFTAGCQKTLGQLLYVEQNLSKRKQMDLSKIIFYNIPYMDVDLNGIPDQWIAASSSDIKIHAGYAYMTVDNKSDKPGAIMSNPLELQSGKEYKVEVGIKSLKVTKTPEISFHINGVMEKPQEMEHTLIQSGGRVIYTGSFKASGDFKQGKDVNTLDLIVSGKLDIITVQVLME